MLPLGINFWTNFGGFLIPKWSQVGTKMGSKIDVNFERRFFWIFGWKLGTKTDRKSIKKRSPRWDASRHRSFSDFGQFLEPCWEAKSSKNRSKINLKRHRKKNAKTKGAKFGKMVAALRYPARRGLGVGSTWARRGLGAGRNAGQAPLGGG